MPSQTWCVSTKTNLESSSLGMDSKPLGLYLSDRTFTHEAILVYERMMGSLAGWKHPASKSEVDLAWPDPFGVPSL